MKILRDGKWIEVPGKGNAALRVANVLREFPELVKIALAAFKPAPANALEMNYALALVNS